MNIQCKGLEEGQILVGRAAGLPGRPSRAAWSLLLCSKTNPKRAPPERPRDIPSARAPDQPLDRPTDRSTVRPPAQPAERAARDLEHGHPRQRGRRKLPTTPDFEPATRDPSNRRPAESSWQLDCNPVAGTEIRSCKKPPQNLPLCAHRTAQANDQCTQDPSRPPRPSVHVRARAELLRHRRRRDRGQDGRHHRRGPHRPHTPEHRGKTGSARVAATPPRAVPSHPKSARRG